MGRSVLVTGGSGYFGTLLADQALARGDRVRTFDLNPPAEGRHVEFVQGDIRDRASVARACEGIDVVLHNVAQVPLAKDRALFESVNVGGTANLLVAARAAGVAKVVHTSSSAVFGIPQSNPVTEDTPPRPLEAYGRAKVRAEVLCREAAAGGLDVTIVRPRTILGHGRLGIMAILFEFVAEGAPVYVLGRGDNRYQFVHADDLADACLRAADRPGPTTYNAGTTRFGTTRETLGGHAGAGRRRPGAVRPVPLAALRRVPLVRHEQGAGRAGLGTPRLQRRDGHRVLRVVPGEPPDAGAGGDVAPPVAGQARPAPRPEAPALKRRPPVPETGRGGTPGCDGADTGLR
jgi:nucleoside-diphosphate-sugar epimerase